MNTLSNSPLDVTVIEAEARKSFSFGMWIVDSNKAPVDLLDSSTTFTIARFDKFGVPTVLLSKTAVIQAPTLGYMTVLVQADELNFKVGTYSFTTTLRIQGYSVVLMKGDFKLLQNSEFESVNEDYAVNNPSQNLQVTLRDQLNVHVELSTVLPPNLIMPSDGSDIATAGYFSNPASATRNVTDNLYASKNLEISVGIIASDVVDIKMVNAAQQLEIDALFTGLSNTDDNLSDLQSQVAYQVDLNAEEDARIIADNALDARIDVLEEGSRGTTLQRDMFFGVPATDPDRVALANRKVTWFNTDLGWEESYYAVTGLTGLTAPGLIVGTASGWYPTGLGPWSSLEPSTTFAASAGNYVGNWNGTVRKRDPLGTMFTANSLYLACNLPGYYDIGVWTTQPTGSGIANWVVRHLNSSGSATVREAHRAGDALHASFFTRAYGFLTKEPMAASERIYLFCHSGALPVHSFAGAAVRGQMSATYVGPLLVSN